MRLRALVLALALTQGAAMAQEVSAPPAAVAVPQARPGQPTNIVKTILVEGEQRYSEAQLISVLGQSVGAPLDQEAINRGIRTLWVSFHVRAEVFLRELPPAGGDLAGQVELLLKVVEMPSDREPRFLGNVDIDLKTLKRWGLIEDRVELFEYQATRVRQRLLEGYRREGYFWVEIEVAKRELSADPQAPGPMTDLIFEIREGPKVRVKKIDVRGNESMPERGFLFWVEGLLTYSKPQLSDWGFFNWWGSPFVQETLDADVLAMRNVYRERGWLDAVVEVERMEWSEDRSEVRISIVIDEGKPYIVDDVQIQFMRWMKDEDGDWRALPLEPGETPARFTPAELLEQCELKSGVRYEEILRSRDQATLREFYGTRGHLSDPSLPSDMKWDFLEPELFTRPIENKVRVTYRIVEAQPLTLREISFAGAHHTLDEVLRREIGVFPGSRADQKEINRGLARIQGTGYFSDQFSPQLHAEPTYRFIEVPGSKERIDLEYEVQEGRVVEFNIAGGVDSNDGAFGLITLSLKNFDIADAPSTWTRTLSELFRKEAFHGGGQRVDLELSPGTRVSRARLHFLEPDIFGLYLEPISFDFDLRRQVRFYRTHDEDRFDKSVRFARKFGFDRSISVGVLHSDLELTDLNSSSVPASILRQEALGTTVQSGFGIDFSARDLDNYVVPHDGWRATLRNTLFTSALSSDFEYFQSVFQGDAYWTTGHRADGTAHVMHLEFDAGVDATYGDTDEVPYTERFFTGGSSSLRGFSNRGAGARGVDVLGWPTSFPAGGETYLSGSLEWLYPLYSVTQPGTYRKVESLRGVIFFDWGVLGQEAGSLDFEDTRASVGFGIGLAYPLPIQLNFGFPIRSFSGDERQTFSFSIGLSF